MQHNNPNSREGRSFEDSFPSLGLAIPLRPGSWVVLAEIRESNRLISTVRSVLGRIENKRLQEAVDVLVLMNTSDRKETYGRLLSYENELFRLVESDLECGSQAAWLVKNIVTWPWSYFQDKTTGITKIEAMAAESMARRRISFPAEFLVSVFVRREQSKLLQTTYYHHFGEVEETTPIREFGSWRDSQFAPNNIRAFPDKFAFFVATKRWSEEWWILTKSRFLEFSLEGF